MGIKYKILNYAEVNFDLRKKTFFVSMLSKGLTCNISEMTKDVKMKLSESVEGDVELK